MTKLAKKIAAVLADEDNNYASLTGKELVSLTKSRKAVFISVHVEVNRYTKEEDGTYYPGVPSSIKVTRRQAVEVAEKFAEYDTRDEEQLFARVYISNWGKEQTDGLYIVI
jgi:hypothetical protein